MSDYILNAPEPAEQPKHAPTGGPASAPALARDLSRQIEQSVKREPLDAVRCVHVFGDFYRCNWWSRRGNQPKDSDYEWGGLSTDHVRQSRFLKATVRDDTLVVEEVVVVAPGRQSFV